MSELSQDELRSIVARDVGGYRLGPDTPGTAKGPIGPAPEATTPDLDALRRKYLGPEAAGQPISKGPVLDEDTIVRVEPDAGGASPGGAPKAVIVSNSERRVIGTQG